MTIINVIFGIRFTDVKPFLKTSVTVDDMTKTLLGLILDEVVTYHTYFQYTDGNIKYDNTGGGGNHFYLSWKSLITVTAKNPRNIKRSQ